MRKIFQICKSRVSGAGSASQLLAAAWTPRASIKLLTGFMAGAGVDTQARTFAGAPAGRTWIVDEDHTSH